MLKEVAFPAKREFLPQMLSKLTAEIKKYVEDEKWINRLKVCSEEILVNIVDYSKSEMVYITCEHVNNSLRFEFTDEGTPYNPLKEAPEVDLEADIDERKIGGLGIFLYTTIMDEIKYYYKDGKNHLTAIKKLVDSNEK